MTRRLLSVGVACALLVSGRHPGGILAAHAEQSAPKDAGLKIVVIDGEGAVNIIQQKTAVAPIVEVRDRNNQPVSGAVVRFAIRGGRATFNGTRALTVTTNAAGRAAVTGLTPTGSGALQISASAAFQGQTAVVTIAQTNVLTVAEAASAAGAGAGGSGGGATAGGTTTGTAGAGGGIGASTLAVVGAAAAGGVVVAAKAAGGDGSGGSKTYTGQISVPVTFTIARAGEATCNDDRVMSGTLTVTLNDPAAGTLTGTAHASYVQTSVGGSCGRQGGSGSFDLGSDRVTGTRPNVGFTLNLTTTGGSGTVFDIYAVAGALAGDVLDLNVDYRGGSDSPGQQNRGAVQFPITLR